MTLNELINDLLEWKKQGFGEFPIFFRNIAFDSDYDVALNNCELTLIDNKLIFL